MTAKEAIKHTVNFCRQVTTAYLEDLSDADLLVRPVPAANHTAWQLGHLIASEQQMMSALGHRMPELPAGFAAAHSPETAKSDEPGRFQPRQRYLELMQTMRAATLAAIDATPENQLDQPAPEPMRSYAPTIAAALTLIGTHELMHAGQFVTVRRKLGKPVLF